MFTGLSSTSTSMLQLHAAGDLVEGAVQVVVGHADALEPARGGRRGVRAAVARHVDPVAAARASRARSPPRPGRARRRRCSRRSGVSSHAVHERVALERRDAPVALVLVGQLHAVALLRDRAGAGPSSGAASSRCRARCGPRRRYSRRRCQSLPLPRAPRPPRRARRRRRRLRRHRRARAGARWTGAAHLRRGQIAGAEVNYVDIGETADDRTPVVFIHGLGGQWQNWLENIPRVGAGAARDRARPARLRALPDAARADHDLRLRPRVVEASATSWASAAVASSATRWAASSAPRWRSSGRSGWSGSCSCPPPASPPWTCAGRRCCRARARGHGDHRATPRPATASWRAARARATGAGAGGPPPEPAGAGPGLEGMIKGAGKPGFVDALRACLELRLPRPAARDRAAPRWSCGARRTPSCRSGTPTSSSG